MDLRIEKTEKAIKNAFIELRSQKPLEKVTVTELCRLACINKSTFYAHYEDVYDLSDALEEEMVQAILGSLSWEETEGKEDLGRFIRELCMSFLSHIYLMKILFSGKEQSRLGIRIERNMKELLYQKYPGCRQDVKKSILFSYLIQGAYHAYLNHQEADVQTLISVLTEVAEAIKPLYD